ncbi:helix-turn-helix transcriptional regulator [Phycisphaerales bacterium AB-hyl4]|uniref:Helix-turn-helix transcriptional regulator n=1 Tax=Natronomicrosphaera hydrolytica TaxID=3242702 RepID=A0ABV4U5L1_9BACT
MGRPAQMWELTDQADRLFPSGYAELTLDLVQSMQHAFGARGMHKILAVRKQQQKQAYLERMKTRKSLAGRLSVLADIRTREGYMAEVLRNEDGSYDLIEKHCPICVVAKNCTDLCWNEWELFEEVLGDNVKIARTEHLVQGARR